MPRLTPDQIRATIAALRARSTREAARRALDHMEVVALEGDHTTLVVLRVKARQLGIVA